MNTDTGFQKSHEVVQNSNKEMGKKEIKEIKNKTKGDTKANVC